MQARKAPLLGEAQPTPPFSCRDPYSWWRSLYTYGYICWEASVCTKDDFHTFMRKADYPGIHGSSGGRAAQSLYIERECGSPCSADHILRTENLSLAWLDLLRGLSLPLVGLPSVNPTGRPRGRTPPPTNFTQEMCDIIHRLDAVMFTEFGYAKRTCPFELP